MNVKKIVAMSFCAATFVGAMTGTAFAGEVTGSGKGGPNGDGLAGGAINASSPCAFSGQQDQPGTGAKVQNYGHMADDPFFGTVFSNKGASQLTLELHPAPGVTVVATIGCNPHVGLGA
jgi:hypothetical protein